MESSGRRYRPRAASPRPTTGTSKCLARMALNFAIPHVHGFRWYPAMQSIIRVMNGSAYSTACCGDSKAVTGGRSEEHTSELQSQSNLVCRLLLEKKKITINSEK